MDIASTNIVEWLSLLVQLAGAGATATLAFLVYRWTKNAQKNEVTRQSQSDWRDYNLAIIGDPDLQNIEASNHLCGGLSSVEVKKMCVFFIKLNVPYNAWIASKNGIVDKKLVDMEISNQANLLRNEQDFIEKHVFPRGYDEDFCEIFRTKWSELGNTPDAQPATGGG